MGQQPTTTPADGATPACTIAWGNKQQALFIEAEAQEAVDDLFGGANTKTVAAGETDDEVPAPSINNSFATATTQDNVATQKDNRLSLKPHK